MGDIKNKILIISILIIISSSILAISVFTMLERIINLNNLLVLGKDLIFNTKYITYNTKNLEEEHEIIKTLLFWENSVDDYERIFKKFISSKRLIGFLNNNLHKELYSKVKIRGYWAISELHNLKSILKDVSVKNEQDLIKQITIQKDYSYEYLEKIIDDLHIFFSMDFENLTTNLVEVFSIHIIKEQNFIRIFLILFFLVIGASMLFFIHLFLFQINEMNRELEIRVQKNTRELSESNKALKYSLDVLNQSQERLLKAEKMASLGSLVAGIAHEINTPLGIGVTAASYLENQMDEISEQIKKGSLKEKEIKNYFSSADKAVKFILTNLERAKELVQSFKNIAADQTSENKREFNVKDYLNTVAISLRPNFKNKNYKIEIIGPDDLIVNSYPGFFSQIITNLIVNSIMHGFENKKSGSIVMTIKKNNSELELVYKDNGKGLTEEESLKIFEPFYTTKRGQGGTGLGMYIVYNLITHNLHGSIRVDSKPKKGVFFFINIPIENSYEGIPL